MTALAKERTLHIALSPADQSQFEVALTNDFYSIVSIVAGIDARAAQVSKVEDREYILGRVAMLPQGCRR